ncbi:uncharacterized protein [Amphiura filiformis]|uniref:uncharacterized protein isoform X2 n=2 Tax=Amphiura filiformis TaxID=82378 RepID=UPI003B2116FF
MPRLKQKVRDLYRRNREKHSSSSSSCEYYSPRPLPLKRDLQCDITVRPPLLRYQKPIMYSPLDSDNEYVCDNGDILAAANEGRRLSDVGRYRQSRMRLKSNAKRALGSSSLSSSSEQRSVSSSTGSFGADTDSNFASFDSQSSRGSCCSLPATRQRTALAKTRWPLPRGKQNPRLLHQYSDSAVFSVTRRMHQDLKMAHLSTDSSTDSPRKLSGESLGSGKAGKTGPHHKKKMLRSQSESAIDVSVVRPIRGMKGSASSTAEQKGIIVSNDDLLKILSDAKKFVPPSKRRSHKLTLGTTPELPQETENDNKNVESVDVERKVSKSSSPEKEGAKLKGKRVSPRIARHSSLHVQLPNRQPIVSRSRAVDVLQLSPVKGTIEQRPITPPVLNKNCLVPPPTSSVIRERPAYGSTLPPRCPSPSELEPMLKSDDNGNQLLEEDEEEADILEEKQIQPEPSTSEVIEKIEEDAKESSGEFDPSLLGEAIERHLSLQKTSPSRSGKKTRSGAALWKGLWNHDKLGNILTKFPFKRMQQMV